MYIQSILKQAPMMSLFKAGNFHDPKQLEAAMTDGVKNVIIKFLIKQVGLVPL